MQEPILRKLLASLLATLHAMWSASPELITCLVLIAFNCAPAAATFTMEFADGPCVFANLPRMGPEVILGCHGSVGSGRTLMHFIKHQLGNGNEEEGKKVAAEWGAEIFKLAFGPEMWLARATAGFMVLHRAFSLASTQFSDMMTGIAWKTEQRSLGDTSPVSRLYPVETALLEITIKMGLIGSATGKFLWASRGPALKGYPNLHPCQIMLTCVYLALMTPRTLKMCKTIAAILPACFFGAFTAAGILQVKNGNGTYIITLAVVGSAVAYEPVADFFKRMNEGLHVFVADVEALLEWAYAKEGRTVAFRFMSNSWCRSKSPWLLFKPTLAGQTLAVSGSRWLGATYATYSIARNSPEFFVFCIAAAMLTNVGVWDASCLPPREPPTNEEFLYTVVSNFCQFFAFVEFVGKPDPDDDQKPKPKPWKSLMLGLPFQIVAFDDEEFKYVTPYMTIRDIVGLWGATPTRESVLADHVDLAKYRGTFPTWTKKLRKKMRKAAGIRQPDDKRDR